MSAYEGVTSLPPITRQKKEEELSLTAVQTKSLSQDKQPQTTTDPSASLLESQAANTSTGGEGALPSASTVDPEALKKPFREFPEPLEPWPKQVDMEVVADEMAALIKRHCILEDKEVDGIVLWLIAGYAINSFRHFAKLTLISPEKRCGKSTLLELTEALSRNGLMTSNLSKAVVYRITAGDLQPTLIIDEADTFVKNGDPELIGIINSSHSQKGARVLKCSGDSHEVKAYSTWMPIVLASIGDLPPTIMDRSLVVRLKRKKPSEQVALLPVGILDNCQPIRRKILRWIIDHQLDIRNNSIQPLDLGNDRATDNWFSLYQVANAISARWLQRCEASHRFMTPVSEMELPTQLLFDIREVWAGRNESNFNSTDLASLLSQDPDKPWATYPQGKPLSPRHLATMLKPYGIAPKSIRFAEGTKRGYERSMFEDAFERYLPKGS